MESRRETEGVVEHTMYQARSAPLSLSLHPTQLAPGYKVNKILATQRSRRRGRREQDKVDNFEVLWGILHVSKMFPPKIK